MRPDLCQLVSSAVIFKADVIPACRAIFLGLKQRGQLACSGQERIAPIDLSFIIVGDLVHQNSSTFAGRVGLSAAKREQSPYR
jgi:hypothetical protein